MIATRHREYGAAIIQPVNRRPVPTLANAAFRRLAAFNVSRTPWRIVSSISTATCGPFPEIAIRPARTWVLAACLTNHVLCIWIGCATFTAEPGLAPIQHAINAAASPARAALISAASRCLNLTAITPAALTSAMGQIASTSIVFPNHKPVPAACRTVCAVTQPKTCACNKADDSAASEPSAPKLIAIPSVPVVSISVASR